MKISTAQPYRGATTVYISGNVDASNAFQLEEELNQVVAGENHNAVIVNFAEVGYISSAGLRVLLTLVRKMKSLDASMILCSMSDNVYKIFKLAGFTKIFTILETESESLNRLGLN